MGWFVDEKMGFSLYNIYYFSWIIFVFINVFSKVVGLVKNRNVCCKKIMNV